MKRVYTRGMKQVESLRHMMIRLRIRFLGSEEWRCEVTKWRDGKRPWLATRDL